MKIQIINNKLLLLFVSSLLMGIAQYPLTINVGFIAWFALIPLISIIYNEKNIKKTLTYSFIWGFLYHIFVVFWLSQNIGTSKVSAFLSMLLAVLVLCFNTVLIVSIWFRIKKYNKDISLFLFPFIWVSVEYIRSYGILGFPWVSIANTQLDFKYLIQNAEFTGIYGISFWVVLINILIYDFFNKRIIKKIYFLLIFMLPWMTGFYLYNQVENSIIEDHKVSSIQPNINLFSKRDYSKRFENMNNLIERSKKHIESGTDLIIWPESALPYNNIQNKNTMEYIQKKLLEDNDSFVLTGNIIYEKNNHYNSSVLINNKGIQNVYNKRQLVPVAEHVPLSSFFPSLKEFNFGQANFSKGQKDILFNVNDIKFSSLICFESTFPNINRRHAKMGADYFIYLVNDGWYTGPPEPQQHMKQSIYRAIENRKTVVRCANTGISAIISPTGEIKEFLDLNTNGEITAFIEKTNGSTFYTVYGNVFSIITLLITMMFYLKTFYDEKTV